MEFMNGLADRELSKRRKLQEAEKDELSAFQEVHSCFYVLHVSVYDCIRDICSWGQHYIYAVLAQFQRYLYHESSSLDEHKLAGLLYACAR